MESEVTLVLPFPDSRLLPNRKLYHIVKWRVTQEAKQIAWGIAKEWLHEHKRWRCAESCTIKYTWYPPDNRRRDEDNYVTAMKPYLDGLVLARLLKDDSKKVIRSSFREFGLVDKVNPRTEVIITACLDEPL